MSTSFDHSDGRLMNAGTYGRVGLLSSTIAIALGASVALWQGKSQSDHLVQDAKQPVEKGQVVGHSTRTVREVRPIVTNLAEPAGAWIRVELALVLSALPNGKADEFLAEFVSDSTDFLRTVTAQEIQGVNGLRRLREDLLDRARFRIGAAVEAVLIQTLVVQ